MVMLTANGVPGRNPAVFYCDRFIVTDNKAFLLMKLGGTQ